MGHGSIHWSELITNDVDGAKKFYGAATGWQFTDMPMPGGTYTMCQIDGRPVAGFAPASMSDAPDLPARWMTYIAVTDIDAVAAQAESDGGKVLQAPFDVPGVGRIAILADPAGAAVGMMTPAENK